MKIIKREIVIEASVSKVWEHITDPIPKADSLVTITLAQEGKATRVTLVHSGWDALPSAEQDKADDYGEGWGSGLEQLRLQIERI